MWVVFGISAYDKQRMNTSEHTGSLIQEYLRRLAFKP